ncbi:helix-turn-helix transcriptional regulator [Megasphaera elsdenii]|uniref:helix-turn-helix domain-containing protein n=1 Tax=Megasphaera elsdenii TaxID=907 RepID=UPI002E790005|nr:helix-turn-helix transcriptional regulator [Megasphaera elsdenii]MEE0404488.1 helix-turn-helix transcriptional regulator [Megasphaera elsdenii]
MAYNIAEIRKSKKMTHKELSKKSGVSRATISKIENGETVEVKLSTIEAISNALDVNWIELIS